MQMIDPNEIGGWVDACPNPALLITLKNHIENRLRQLKDSEAAKNLHPQLKRHMPASTETAQASAPPVPDTAPAKPAERSLQVLPANPNSIIRESADNPYDAFQNDSPVHVPTAEPDSK